jgi:hypothetical protein
LQPMRARTLLLAGVVVALAATGSAPAKVPGGCPVTVTNGYVPPGAPSTFYGNGLLATAAYGVITRAPEADGSISEKYPWWGAGVPPKPLRIIGRKLELALTPLTALRAHDGFTASVNEGYVEGSPRGTRFWSSGVTFPTQGCWQVIGVVGSVRLAVVVHVQAGTISSSSSSVK